MDMESRITALFFINPYGGPFIVELIGLHPEISPWKSLCQSTSTRLHRRIFPDHVLALDRPLALSWLWHMIKDFDQMSKTWPMAAVASRDNVGDKGQKYRLHLLILI